MLVKHPKPSYKKWLKKGALVLFVVEAASFAVSYYGWAKVNTDRDSRKYLKDNFPAILEAYYRTGEYLSPDSKIREIDLAYWNAEGSPKY